MIKEIISVVMSILLSITSIFTGVHNGSINKVKTVSKGEYAYANEIGSEIVRCLREKDKKALNNLYCDRIKEIDIIFDYIDGNGGLSIEDSTWSVPTSHGSFNGGKSIAYVSCKYDKIVYINNKEYELRFTAYQVLKYNKQYEGVLTISINEYKNHELIEKSLKYQEMNNNEKIVYLGFHLRNTNYSTYQSISILPKELYINDLYEIPNNLEDDR